MAIINSLQKRLGFLVLLPAAMVLLFIGISGFVTMRAALAPVPTLCVGTGAGEQSFHNENRC